MSVFFGIVSAILYGVCHLLARTAKPGGPYSFQHEILYDGEREIFMQALRDWVGSHSRLRMHTETNDKIIIDQRSTSLFFGAFFYFEINDGDGSLIIKIATQPKLISTGKEKALILENLCRWLEKTQEAA